MELAISEIIGRRQIAAFQELGRTVERRRGRTRCQLETRYRVAVGAGLEYGDGRLGRRRIGVGVDRATGADQILVIEERTAERALKKMIGQYVLARQSVQRR